MENMNFNFFHIRKNIYLEKYFYVESNKREVFFILKIIFDSFYAELGAP